MHTNVDRKNEADNHNGLTVRIAERVPWTVLGIRQILTERPPNTIWQPPPCNVERQAASSSTDCLDSAVRWLFGQTQIREKRYRTY